MTILGEKKVMLSVGVEGATLSSPVGGGLPSRGGGAVGGAAGARDPGKAPGPSDVLSPVATAAEQHLPPNEILNIQCMSHQISGRLGALSK